jgi:ABC-type Zn uptake system ZnuABC Zn-binding protein ZnuA
MNTWGDPASKGKSAMALRESTIARRRFMRTLAAFGLGGTVASALLGGARSAAAAGPLQVSVPTVEMAAIAKAVGGDHVAITVDGSIGPKTIEIAGEEVSLEARIMLKGKGASRRRFLDDPRNAPKLGAAIRDALNKAAPVHAKVFADNHKNWSRPFARRVLKWQAALAKSSVKGKRIRDDYGRRYVLEWAGATVDPKGRPSPTALSKVPPAAKAPTLAAYAAYIDALVAALG